MGTAPVFIDINMISNARVGSAVIVKSVCNFDSLRNPLEYVRFDVTIGADVGDVMETSVMAGGWFIHKMELLSAQPVLDALTVKAAVVVPQSHTSLGLPCTDMDGKYVKQFSVCA